MAYDLDDILSSVRASRAFLLRHIKGMTADQWTWKPYPSCKAVRETLIHLIADDHMALESLKTGKMPADIDALVSSITAASDDDTNEELIERVTREQERLLLYVRDTYGGEPLDREIAMWGDSGRKLGSMIHFLSSEDFYHAGQLAFIRLATDPTWDYYGEIYGAG